jgi:hypothetical protein
LTLAGIPARLDDRTSGAGTGYRFKLAKENIKLRKDGIITLKDCSCGWFNNWFSSRSGNDEPNNKDDGGSGELHFSCCLLGFGFKNDICIVLAIYALRTWLSPLLKGKSSLFYTPPPQVIGITASCNIEADAARRKGGNG